MYRLCSRWEPLVRIPCPSHLSKNSDDDEKSTEENAEESESDDI